MIEEITLPTPELVRQRNIETDFDSRGRLLYARTTDKTIMDRCVQLGYLDHYHAEYAHLYLELKAAWQAPTSYKISSLSNELVSLLREWDCTSADIYDAVSSQLEADLSAVVVMAATSIWDKALHPVSAAEGDVCFKAFEAMVKAMENAHSKVKKA